MADYYISRVLDMNPSEAEDYVRNALQSQGFGVMSEIDVKNALKQKIDVDFRFYKILGACNPQFAYQALQAEDKIGTMLPCNVVLQEIGENQTEVAAIDPVASMQAVENDTLKPIASQVRDRLQMVIDQL